MLIQNASSPDPAGSIKVGYARVSTEDQNPLLQVDALKAAGIPEDLIFIDIESGTVKDREHYRRICKDVLAGKIQEVWVYRLDRLGRDHYELVSFLQLLEDASCQLVSICEPFAKDWMQSSWAFRALWEALGDARYELLRLKERQRAGIDAKRAAVKAGRASWPGRGPDKGQRKQRG